MNPEDENEIVRVVLIIAGAVALLGTGALGFHADVGKWLRTSHLLVEHATLPVPGLGGIGLDIARLVVLAGLLTFAGAMTWIALRHHKTNH
ncbi:hypothetical protein ACFV9C_42640 [Kribbella sp. NPDC059898]|uniref:hypothetical protein n=1 Tax=Kribbella sp. NPDC059898 TaxID=3346995 RepID=UPI003654A2A2